MIAGEALLHLTELKAAEPIPNLPQLSPPVQNFFFLSSKSESKLLNWVKNCPFW